MYYHDKTQINDNDPFITYSIYEKLYNTKKTFPLQSLITLGFYNTAYT